MQKYLGEYADAIGDTIRRSGVLPGALANLCTHSLFKDVYRQTRLIWFRDSEVNSIIKAVIDNLYPNQGSIYGVPVSNVKAALDVQLYIASMTELDAQLRATRMMLGMGAIA